MGILSLSIFPGSVHILLPWVCDLFCTTVLDAPNSSASCQIDFVAIRHKPIYGEIDVINSERGRAQSRPNRRYGQEILWKHKIFAIMRIKS